MLTLKELMENPTRSSPDGKHWEPALPYGGQLWWRIRVRDAWEVLRGRACAVRQTEKADLLEVQR